MKNLFKILAAVVLMAGVCLAVYELFRRWDEGSRKCSDGTLKHFIDRGLRKKDDEDTIADYRDEEDDDLYEELLAEHADAADSDDEDTSTPVDFDLSEDALEQLLDS